MLNVLFAYGKNAYFEKVSGPAALQHDFAHSEHRDAHNGAATVSSVTDRSPFAMVMMVAGTRKNA
jgi:hypothetical protein